jgi:hypothetical protein
VSIVLRTRRAPFLPSDEAPSVAQERSRSVLWGYLTEVRDGFSTSCREKEEGTCERVPVRVAWHGCCKDATTRMFLAARNFLASLYLACCSAWAVDSGEDLSLFGSACCGALGCGSRVFFCVAGLPVIRVSCDICVGLCFSGFVEKSYGGELL